MEQGVRFPLMQRRISQQTDEIAVAAMGRVNDDLFEAVPGDKKKNVEVQLLIFSVETCGLPTLYPLKCSGSLGFSLIFQSKMFS